MALAGGGLLYGQWTWGVGACEQMSKKATIIVAHPDDEVIWCGGLILQRQQWNWTVLSLSRADDRDRRPKFEAVCRLLKVTGHISTLDDGTSLKPVDCAREIGDRIARHLGSAPWDLCITHGANGEYGHPRHKQVHAQVLELARDGFLECAELWTFAYRCDAETGRCEPAPDADVFVDLTDEQLQEKRRIIREEYGYGEDAFEVKACVRPEAFRTRKLSSQDLET